MNGEITRQATIITHFNDDFKLMMIVALTALPLVVLLRKTKPQGRTAEAVLE